MMRACESIGIISCNEQFTLLVTAFALIGLFMVVMSTGYFTPLRVRV
jgi:hypothetical protein